MTALDYLLLLPIVIGAYEGYKKGFVMMITGLIALVLGVAGAFELLFLGIRFLEGVVPNMPKLIPIMAFVLLFVGIVVLVYLLGLLLKKTLDLTFFAGKLDNVFGALVGITQWLFITSVLLWLAKQSGYVSNAYFTNALLVPYVVLIAPKSIGLLTWLFPFASKLFKDIKSLW